MESILIYTYIWSLYLYMESILIYTYIWSLYLYMESILIYTYIWSLYLYMESILIYEAYTYNGGIMPFLFVRIHTRGRTGSCESNFADSLLLLSLNLAVRK